ncbi:hypothetical protein L227DRAFT_575790 [Lentinus tigrinus ALCF2SS1-6]|uniref:Glycopeptide n=1 Tax=Lentinus tigrinus ALCF2SS1-6 TaxID=1328759 RepID=A0A5C2S7W2_9APHY|nr:hypothetical protein L227DRAFT_575790 [Lentinus tigrinus ALCF2SS1-6]
MQLSFVVSAVAMAILSGVSVRAETHTIRFENKCGKGTPQLIQNGKVLSSGEDFVSNGPFTAGIAYLQTGECLFNGEECTLLEMTLVNPVAPGSVSSTDISLITPHAFNVAASFSYFNGCDRQGTTCNSADCTTAFHKFDDNQVQVQCDSSDVDVLITFCGDATQSTAFASGSSKLSSDVFSRTSAAASTKSAVSHATSSTKVATTAVSPVANVATSASASAVTSSASASSTLKCRAGARHRRRSTEQPEVAARASYDAHRRHHARNVAAVGRAASH